MESSSPAASEGEPVRAGSPGGRLRPALLRLVSGRPLQLLVVALEITVFSALWTSYDWNRYLTLHLYAFDFGVSVRDIWSTTTGPIITEHTISNLFVLAYWALPNQANLYFFLLAFQNVFVFLGALPLYLLARARLQSGIAALALATAYVLYPALTGMVWFPFHFEAFFPTLFLTGYWLYRIDRRALAAGVLLFATTTNIGSPIIVGALGVGLLAEPMLAWVAARVRGRATRLGLPRADAVLALLLVAGSVAMLLIVVYGQGLTSTSDLVARSASSTSGGIAIVLAPTEDLGSKLLVLLLLFGPLLALPLFAREERWPLIAFWIPALATSNSVFLDPFHDQYGCLFVGVAFAATVRALEEIRGRARSGADERPAGRGSLGDPVRRRLHGLTARRAALSVLGLVAVTFLLLFPWSPVNALATGPATPGFAFPPFTYDPSAFVQGNRTVDAQILDMVAAVPPTGGALVEDNLPELFERSGTQVTGCFAAGDAVQYVVTDPYDSSFLDPLTYPPSCDSTVSMYWWSDHFLSEGWGILEEADGAVVLTSNYSAAPRLYYPANERFTPDDLRFSQPSGNYLGNDSAPGRFFTGPTQAPWGGGALLFPGTFWVNLTIEVDHPSPGSLAYWTLTPSNGSGFGFNVTVSGAALEGDAGVVKIPVEITSWEYVLQPEFAFTVEHWTGGLRAVALSVAQSAPYRAENGSLPG